MTTQGNGQYELRIGDAERDAAVGALGEHYAAGRLSREEYDDRSERAWAARTNSDLTPLFVDLPDGPGSGDDRSRPDAATQTAPRSWRRRSWPGVPWPAIVLAVVVVVAVTHLWPLLFILGLLWCSGVVGPRRWADGRGPWSHRRW